MDQKVVTRFAPSPTGNLHSGSYRTAIFAYLFARQNRGTFVLRIEDTDKARSTVEYENNILDSLKWLGLEHDIFVRQSENNLRHKEVLEKMIADGHAYISKEEAKDGSGVIKEIVRFKNPNIDVTFHDEIKGDVTMHTKDLGDFVIAKNINEPLFHLAVVVDDFDEGITHVIRGEDHVSNTPRQILIQRAIGAPTPVYAHLPLVLGLDKQKLSKRKGALAMTEYRDLGYLPEALLNMVAMVGWNPGTEQELFSKDELVAAFKLNQVQKSPAVFNPEKLNWFNREYIKKLSSDEQKNLIKKFMPEKLSGISDEMLSKLVPVITERLNYFGELFKMADEGEFDYCISTPQIDLAKLPGKGNELANAKLHLEKVLGILKNIDEKNWNAVTVKESLWSYAEEAGKGNVLWPMRFALSGRDKSPDPFTLADILGREETIVRIEKAVSLIS
ncbi:MAG: glutamyl-tRNA synthetase, glutamyl-tRNA synthetase [Patescibacteria group bacterium]|nr:glutamyl-tRNA synthetase, glutamyl-tRNA synthetase [Patescibacteria group bacterium]